MGAEEDGKGWEKGTGDDIEEIERKRRKMGKRRKKGEHWHSITPSAAVCLSVAMSSKNTHSHSH